jgi:hypothetical protein
MSNANIYAGKLNECTFQRREGDFELWKVGNEMALFYRTGPEPHEWIAVMQNSHENRAQYEFLATDAFGRVICTGLGMALMVDALCRNPKVTQITVVEKYPEVWPLISGLTDLSRVSLLISPADEINYSGYDCVFLDHWLHCNEAEKWEHQRIMDDLTNTLVWSTFDRV